MHLKQFYTRLVAINLMVLLLCGALFFWVDQPVATFLQKNVQPEFKQIMHIITDIGLGAPYFIIVFLGYIVAVLFLLVKNNIYKKILFYNNQFLSCLLLSGLLVHIFKISIGRLRPYQNPTLDPLAFSPFNWHWHWQSFPSGHAQVIATVCCFVYIYQPRFKYLLIPLSLLVGFSRLTEQAHYVSDILMGWMVGITGTLIVLKNFVIKKELQHKI